MQRLLHLCASPDPIKTADNATRIGPTVVDEQQNLDALLNQHNRLGRHRKTSPSIKRGGFAGQAAKSTAIRNAPEGCQASRAFGPRRSRERKSSAWRRDETCPTSPWTSGHAPRRSLQSAAMLSRSPRRGGSRVLPPAVTSSIGKERCRCSISMRIEGRLRWNIEERPRRTYISCPSTSIFTAKYELGGVKSTDVVYDVVV
jgi:hypothetical protein